MKYIIHNFDISLKFLNISNDKINYIYIYNFYYKLMNIYLYIYIYIYIYLYIYIYIYIIKLMKILKLKRIRSYLERLTNMCMSSALYYLHKVELIIIIRYLDFGILLLIIFLQSQPLQCNIFSTLLEMIKYKKIKILSKLRNYKLACRYNIYIYMKKIVLYAVIHFILCVICVHNPCKIMLIINIIEINSRNIKTNLYKYASFNLVIFVSLYYNRSLIYIYIYMNIYIHI